MLLRMMKTVFRFAVSVKWPLSILSTLHSVAIPRKKPRNAVLFLCLLASVKVFAAKPLNQSVHSGFTDSEVVAQVAIEEPSYQVVDVGVLAIRGYKATINRWQPLMGWLETQIPNSYFRLHPLTLDELAKGVETQGLDFVITNPGQSVLLARQYSLTWLATLRSPLNNGAAMQVGSALVVRADSPYHTLSDLKAGADYTF